MSSIGSVNSCKRIGQCGGCPGSTQRRSPSGVAEMVFRQEVGLRDRIDFVWELGDSGQMNLGLYGGPNGTILDLPECPLMSPRLAEFYSEYRKKSPPGLKKGSVRLRVSPRGERGVWLDFANADIKMLFDEREYLVWLSELAFVEIGQRRKALSWKEGRPKLVEPELHPWFETYDGQGASIPLYMPVGGFSQVGFNANRALVEAVTRAVRQSGLTSWVELFCGSGNFSLSLAAQGFQVEAFENDVLAVEGLERSMNLKWKDNVKVTRADVYSPRANFPDLKGKGLLVDPPRSGLRALIHRLEQGPRPEALIYVSCFSESLVSDLAELERLGGQVQSMAGIDQFPNTAQVEWVSLITF